MSLRINHNIAAINGHRNMVANDMAISRNLERLSSGLRINKAADDAAGLVISEQMRAQITGLNQAIDNNETAISMVQTAEGALDEINSLLNKARELAIHAANEGVNDENQLLADQKELDNAIRSISRISEQTQFGTKKLIDGSLAAANTYDTSKVFKFDVGTALLARTDYTGGQVSVVIDTSAETNATVAIDGTGVINTALGANGTIADFFAGTQDLSTAGRAVVRIEDEVLSFGSGAAMSGPSALAILNNAQSAYSFAVSGGATVATRIDETGYYGAARDISMVFYTGTTGVNSAAGASATYTAGRTLATTLALDGTDNGSTVDIGGTSGAFTAAGGTVVTDTIAAALGTGTNKLADGASITISVGGRDYVFSSQETVSDIVSFVNNAQEDYILQADADNGMRAIRANLGSAGAATDLAVRIKDPSGTSTAFQASVLAQGEDVQAHLSGDGLPGGRINLVSDSDNATKLRNNVNGILIEMDSGSVRASEDTTAFMTKGALFQVGPNDGQLVGIDIKAITATFLGLGADPDEELQNLQDVVNQQALINGMSTNALRVIDAAIDDVTVLRGQLGAFQANTLETNLNSLRVSDENLTAAESTIRDTDFAAESAEFTRNNILVQSSTAMLAQANQLPQNVLQLLQ